MTDTQHTDRPQRISSDDPVQTTIYNLLDVDVARARELAPLISARLQIEMTVAGVIDLAIGRGLDELREHYGDEA